MNFEAGSSRESGKPPHLHSVELSGSVISRTGPVAWCLGFAIAETENERARVGDAVIVVRNLDNTHNIITRHT